jgi:lysozyme
MAKKKKYIKPHSVGALGLARIARFEGFSSKPYQDPVGVWTIGYGETQGVGPHTKPISRVAALRQLRRRINRDYLPHVLALNMPRQGMDDAIVSFIYNLGPGAIAPTTGVGRALHARKWRTAADEMLRWDMAGGRHLPGLTKRRQEERRVFLRAVKRI